MRKYLVIKPEQNCGICGYIWQTIRGIYHNPHRNYYIDFSNNIYQPRGSSINIWDKFFYQPSTEEAPAINEIENQIGIIFNEDSEFVWQNIKPNTIEEIQKRRIQFSNIIKIYFKLKPEIENKINTFYNNNFAGKKVLAIHFRGTDHPNKKPMDDYLSKIKNYMHEYDKIFVCSDEHERFRLAEVMFGDKFISYDSLRSDAPDTPLHNHPNDPRSDFANSSEYQLRIATDAIVEAFLMSKSDMLICCSDSNVNLLSRAINPYLPSISL